MNGKTYSTRAKRKKRAPHTHNDPGNYFSLTRIKRGRERPFVPWLHIIVEFIVTIIDFYFLFSIVVHNVHVVMRNGTFKSRSSEVFTKIYSYWIHARYSKVDNP